VLPVPVGSTQLGLAPSDRLVDAAGIPLGSRDGVTRKWSAPNESGSIHNTHTFDSTNSVTNIQSRFQTEKIILVSRLSNILPV
jgi:hypothetical protein